MTWDRSGARRCYCHSYHSPVLVVRHLSLQRAEMATSYCEIKIHPFPILYHDLKKKPEKKATEHFQGRGKFHGSFYDFGNGKSIKCGFFLSMEKKLGQNLAISFDSSLRHSNISEALVIIAMTPQSHLQLLE